MIDDLVGRPVRLVHLTTSPLSLNFLEAQIDYVRQRGYEVHCVTSRANWESETSLPDDVPIHGVPMSREISPLRDLVSVFRLWQTFRRLDPDILQLHMSKAGLLGSLAGRLARIPICLYDNQGSAFFSEQGLRGWLIKSAERLTCMAVDGVQCASQSVRQKFVDDGVCPPEKIEVLANGSYGVEAEERFLPSAVSSQDLQDLRAELGIPGSAPVIGFLGRIIRLKGIPELLAAWRRIRAEFPNSHLLLVGAVDPRAPLPPEIEAELQGQRVTVTGWVDDPRPYYALIDVLALPSLHEGLPVSLLEAAAMEVPVVATRIPGSLDAVVDGVTGTLIPTHDPDALARAISSYLRDPQLRREQGRAARQRVLREFLPGPICEAFYSTYQTLLSERGLAHPTLSNPVTCGT